MAKPILEFTTKSKAKRALKSWVAEHQHLNGEWWEGDDVRFDHEKYMVMVKGEIVAVYIRRNPWGKGWLLSLPCLDTNKVDKMKGHLCNWFRDEVLGRITKRIEEFEIEAGDIVHWRELGGNADGVVLAIEQRGDIYDVLVRDERGEFWLKNARAYCLRPGMSEYKKRKVQGGLR